MIAPKYQIFDRPITITSKDDERLRSYLSGWNRVVECILRGANDQDLRRLVIMELMGKQRSVIINKLLVRLGKLQRAELQRRIDRLCGKA